MYIRKKAASNGMKIWQWQPFYIREVIYPRSTGHVPNAKHCDTTSFVSCMPVHIAAYSDTLRSLQFFCV